MVSVNAQLSGRVAVVTGGATGIGRATALLLAEHGAQVFVGDYDFVAAQDAEFEQLGIHKRPCDVRSEADVAGLIETAVAGRDGIDILVNNAGIAMVKPITEVSTEDWDACIGTNLKGAFLGCKHAIPQMQRRGGGGDRQLSQQCRAASA